MQPFTARAFWVNVVSHRPLDLYLYVFVRLGHVCIM